jgi:two-component system sensor histidine kinase PhoQ
MILTVADDGNGIPADAVDALLQRGTRLDETMPGHGIGLAIVAEIARSYGGEISIKRATLGGAEIIVAIPAATATATAMI